MDDVITKVKKTIESVLNVSPSNDPDVFRAIEETVSFFENARVSRVWFQVHKEEVFARIQLSSKGSKKRITSHVGIDNICMAVVSSFYKTSFKVFYSPSFQVIADEIIRLMPEKMGEISQQYSKMKDVALNDEKSVAPVRHKLRAAREKSVNDGIRKIQQVIKRHKLQSGDVTRAWNEHLAKEVIES
jgi:hypothetical protein